MQVLSKILQAMGQAVGMGARKLPARFQDRIADVQLWRDRFGGDFAVADRMLCIFCDAFMFAPEERYKFRPEDTINEIYREVYPSRETPDALEDKFLLEGLEKEFGFTFDDARLEKIESFQQIVAEIKSTQQSAPANGALPRR